MADVVWVVSKKLQNCNYNFNKWYIIYDNIYILETGKSLVLTWYSLGLGWCIDVCVTLKFIYLLYLLFYMCKKGYDKW